MGILSYWRARRELKSFQQLLEYISDNSVAPRDVAPHDTRGQELLNHTGGKSGRSLKRYTGLKDKG